MANVSQLTHADPTTLAQINSLLHQFNDSEISQTALERLLEDKKSELWVVKDDEAIIGMATLVIITRLAGVTTRIEDVVVDEAHRGKGLGRILCQALIDRAKEVGAYSIHLTSRPEREAANALYQKLGFERRNTNAYRLSLAE